MPSIKLTKRNIDAIPPLDVGKKQELYWDTELKGFMLRVTRSVKAFAVESRVNGKTVRASIGWYGRLTPDEARDIAKVKLADMTKGENPNEQKREAARLSVTLDDAYQAYIKERQLRPNTLRDYDRAMRIAFDDWRKTPLVSLTRSMVEKRFDHLSVPTLNDDGEVLKKNKAFPNQAFRFLRALLNWASEAYANNDEPLLLSNPCNGLKARKKWHKIKRRDGWIRPDQMAAFFAALEHLPNHTERQKSVRDLCAMYALTGIRLTEGATLTWDLIDLKRKTLTISSDRAKNHNKLELPIGKWLVAMLKRRKAANEALPEDRRSIYVFPGDGKTGRVKDFADVIEGIEKDSGIAFTPHDLRRTFLTVANNHVKSLSAYTLKRLVNHAVDSESEDVTAGYIIIDPETLREPMQQIENFILRSAGVVETAEVIDIQTAKRTA